MNSYLIYDKKEIILRAKKNSLFTKKHTQVYFIKRIRKNITSEILFIINDYEDLYFLFKIKNYNLNLIPIVINREFFKKIKKSEKKYFSMKYFYELIKI
ncbi:MAG: hypothetical protein V4666_09035 [Bacteroidota bacterium]